MKSQSRFFSTIQADIPAAIVVFLVALPLCLGIALASGVPLISGIIAGVVGGVLVGSLSGSSVGVSGPAAGLAVIVMTSIQDLGAFDVFLVAVVLAGVIQVILGFAKAGIIAYYFPSSVITGMLAGIGIIIFLKQIPHAFGYDRNPEGDLSFLQKDGLNTLSELSVAFNSLSLGPIIIALLSLAILLSWETPRFKKIKFCKIVPGALLAVGAGVLLNVLFRSFPGFSLLPEQMVNIPEISSFKDFSNLFTFPDFSALANLSVYKVAIVVAVVASIETLLCVEATDKLDPQRRVTPTNRELKAQGIGNIVSGLVGGLPITQVIVRGSANVLAGGQSKLSAITHALFLAVSVFALPTVMNLIPLSTLAAILLIVGYKLAKPSLFKKMYTQGLGQFVPFIVTVLGIVFTDLLLGVGLGIVVAILVILYQNFQLPFYVKNLELNEGQSVCISLAQQVTFLNKATVLKSLDSIPKHISVEIDGSDSVFIHPDVAEIIDNFAASAKLTGRRVVVSGLEASKKVLRPEIMKFNNKNRQVIGKKQQALTSNIEFSSNQESELRGSRTLPTRQGVGVVPVGN